MCHLFIRRLEHAIEAYLHFGIELAIWFAANGKHAGNAKIGFVGKLKVHAHGVVQIVDTIIGRSK